MYHASNIYIASPAQSEGSCWPALGGGRLLVDFTATSSCWLVPERCTAATSYFHNGRYILDASNRLSDRPRRTPTRTMLGFGDTSRAGLFRTIVNFASVLFHGTKLYCSALRQWHIEESLRSTRRPVVRYSAAPTIHVFGESWEFC